MIKDISLTHGHLMPGRIDKFSLDALTNLAEGAGLAVQLKIRNAA
jgi:predicted XRE-type DNA-binding protein